jgi:hydrogenase maturation protease
MKPTLVVGLGNPLMGDEGVGWHVAEQLAVEPGLPESVEVISGGTDLLRYAARMEGRSRVFVVDALQDDAQPGTVSVLEEACPGLDERQDHAHHLSAWQSMKLLKMLMPVRFTLLGISISSAAAGTRLSPGVAGRMATILDRVLQELIWNSSN